MKKTIAVLEGDGIGPEITREALKVVCAIEEKYNHSFEILKSPFGAQAYFDEGHPFPEQTKKLVDSSDAVLKGPIGLAKEKMKEIPTEFSPEGAALLPLRKRLDTYANFRPVVLPKDCIEFSPLKPERLGDGLDILMMRELVGGIYFGDKVEGKDTNMEYASDECKYTKEQVERFAHMCLKEARQRGQKLTIVHKKNVKATGRFFNDIFQGNDIYEGIAKQYPDVELEEVIVDAGAFYLVTDPTRFNGVMAFSNMEGDILTDEAGGILGSLGLMPSACLNPETGKGYYEPAHGSAPKIAGQNVANPYSMIGSVAFMLDKSFGLKQESQEVWSALIKVFGQGYRTGELATPETPKNKILSTSQFGDKVVENLVK